MVSKNKFIGISLLLVFTVVSALNIFCNSPSGKQEKQFYLNHNDTVKYVGIETCRSCHNDIYQTFIETGMGSSFDVASTSKSAADFSRHHVVYDKFKDLYYHPFLKNDSMYIMEYRLEGKDTVHKRVERVDYIIGSGQHTNSHMMNVNGFVYQLPLTWYAQKRKWDLPPGFEDGHNVRFNRAIGFECMSCHNALPEFADNSMNKFISIPNGIDCERCHGPGEVHVKEKLAGIRVDTATQVDYTIVNPKKLSWELQIDICQRCHLQGNAVLKQDKNFNDFRPGQKLSDFIDIYMPKYEGRDEEFIMASHAQRLQMSQCFLSTTNNPTENSGTQSAHTLTCITCHNPHVSVKITGKQIFNNTCGNCHNTQTACTEKESIRLLQQNNCVGCHMPKSGTIDIPHVTVTDHWIRKPVKQQEKNNIKTFAGIYCINNKQSDDFTHAKAYIAYYEKFEGESIALDSAETYLSKTTNIPNTVDAKIHLLYLKQDYQGIILQAKDFKPDAIHNPWLCYRIGQSYQNLKNYKNAELWYARAVKLADENLDFINKYGTILVELDKTDVGITVLKSSLAKNPKQPEAHTNLGFAYLKQQQLNLAMQHYNHALALDPDMQQALFNKAALCNMTGDTKQAKRLLQQILKTDPQNEYVKQLLESL